jgi:hypothetical protein
MKQCVLLAACWWGFPDTGAVTQFAPLAQLLREGS